VSRKAGTLQSLVARTLTLVLSSRADVALTGPAPLFAGRALTSHFGVAQPMRGPVGLGVAGWRRSADHDRRSLRELAPKRGHAGNHAARPSEAEPRWPHEHELTSRVNSVRPSWAFRLAAMPCDTVPAAAGEATRSCTHFPRWRARLIVACVGAVRLERFRPWRGRRSECRCGAGRG
jgi:hypothetical protein